MVGILDPNDPNSSAFFANNPNVNQQLRQRLALQLLGSRRKAYPTTIGAGLTEIGDALGDRSLIRSLEQSDVAAQGITPPAAEPAGIRPGPQASADDDTEDGDTARPVVADVPIAPRPLAAAPQPTSAADADPGLYGAVRTNPDGSIAGNLTAPTRPPGPSSGLIPPQINGIDPRTRMAMALMQQRGGLRPNPTDPEAATSPDIQAPGGQQPDQRLASLQPPPGGAIRQGPYTIETAAPPPTATDIQPAPPGLPPAIRSGPQAIQPAPQPPPQQMAQVAQPGQPAPTPGYVPPQLEDPAAPPTIGMGKRELQLRQWVAANQGNPYAAGKVAAELDSLEKDRTNRQNQANELWKARIQQKTEQDKLREQARIDQAKRIADVERTQQETQSGRLIDPSDKQYVYGPDNVARPLKIEGGGGAINPTLTEVQTKNLDYYQRGRRALADLGSGEELQSFMKWYAGGAPVLGNALVDAKYQEQLNAAREFAAIVLRKESGAAVTAKELDDVMHRYIPRPGDKPDLTTQKDFMRNGAISSLRTTLGKGSAIADRFDQNFPAERERLQAAKKQNLINTEMDGVPKVPGVVKTNKKTGAKRMWDGSRWTEVP